MTVAYLSTVATSLLNTARAALVVATTGHAAPGESYVAHSEPAADNCCEGQLTIHLDRLGHESEITAGGGQNFALQQCCAVVPTAHFVLTLMRCQVGMTDGNDPTPDPDDVEVDAINLLIDLWAILTQFYDEIAAKTLLPGMGADCCGVVIGDVTPLDTEGQCAGWLIPIAVELNDPGPVGS